MHWNVEKFGQCRTPFYYYDLGLLRDTLETIKVESEKYKFHIHYAIKANANDRILNIIRNYGLDADCVSGNEIRKSLENGFSPGSIVYAGVGKSDEEIRFAIDMGIFSINCESIEELILINEISKEQHKVTPIAIRINPNVDACTHEYITTGTEESKFGINHWEFEELFRLLKELQHVQLTGLHFHIGSQICDLNVYEQLCHKVNRFQEKFERRGFKLSHINLGGGLGIDYFSPEKNKIADFESFFSIFNSTLNRRPGQSIHFELGRSVVAQSGSLITKVLYIKNGVKTKFVVVDAGMTDLIRPALYNAFHKIDNLTSNKKPEVYHIVGPICESADCFGKHITLPETKRNDLLAIRSAGAYGEVMASRYNLRSTAGTLYSDDIPIEIIEKTEDGTKNILFH